MALPALVSFIGFLTVDAACKFPRWSISRRWITERVERF